jgi:hypothetical protein
MKKYTRVYDPFEYRIEDLDCHYCKHFRPTPQSRERRCELDECSCADIRAEAAAHGRLKRKRGWNRP